MTNKILITTFAFLVVAGYACKKDSDPDPPTENPVTSQQVLTDFTNLVANPNYQDLQVKATLLHSAVVTLNATTTDPNLLLARDAWKAVRTPWEQSEAFLFGPAEDFNYDPATDSWPVNTTELDSLLLISPNPLLLENIDSLDYTLKGYHPIEYMLFGVGGTKVASDFTPREKQYLMSLTESLLNSVTDLKNSWDPAHGNFSAQVTTAGAGSLRYLTRKDALLTIVSAMGGICNEVANGKMEEPLAALDSELVESQYAQISSIDFKNNMIGVQNVYLSRYTTTGHSLHDLVAAKNANLDNTIKANITTAINALAVLNPNYGIAIHTQVGQIHTAQSAINDLEGSLNQLTNFIQQNITD